MTARVFPLAQPPTPEAIAAAVDAFFQDALSGVGPFEAAFSTLHVDSAPSAPDDFDVICDDVHDAAYDPEIAALVSRAAETLRPLIRVVIARTVRDLSYVVPADEHLSDDDLRAHVVCGRCPSRNRRLPPDHVAPVRVCRMP